MTKQIPILRTSERSAFRRCPQLWWWAYREGWTPKIKQADARWFGIGIHLALEPWYMKGTKRGPHPADTWTNWYDEEEAYAKTYLGDDFDEPAWVDAFDLGVAMLEGYVDRYGKDPQWSFIATEMPFSIRVTRFGKPVAIFRSRWDGVFRDLRDGRIKLLETKTASQIATAYLKLDDQGGSYWAVAGPYLRAKGILKPKEEIAGIEYNFLKKSMPDERPTDEQGYHLNKDNTRSKRQPKPAFYRELIERSPEEQYMQMKRMADEVAIMNAVRDGTLPITKSTTRDCTRCDFFAQCQLHERGSKNWLTVMKNDYEQVNPYEDMRKSA